MVCPGRFCGDQNIQQSIHGARALGESQKSRAYALHGLGREAAAKTQKVKKDVMMSVESGNRLFYVLCEDGRSAAVELELNVRELHVCCARGLAEV
jgi:hypothetical protein